MKQLDQSISAAEGNLNRLAEDSSEQLTESARYYPTVTSGRVKDSQAESSRAQMDLDLGQIPDDVKITYIEPGGLTTPCPRNSNGTGCYLILAIHQPRLAMM